MTIIIVSRIKMQSTTSVTECLEKVTSVSSTLVLASKSSTSSEDGRQEQAVVPHQLKTGVVGAH